MNFTKNPFTASYLIRQQADLTFSLDVYRVVKEKGRVSISLIAALMGAYERAGQTELASYLSDELLEIYNTQDQQKKKLNDYEWNSIIKAMTSHKRDKDALKIFVHMTRENVQPHPSSVLSILNSFLRLQDLNSIMSLVPFIDP